MSETNGKQVLGAADPVQAAIAAQVLDIVRTAEAVQQAAGAEDLYTLDRAAALVELAAVADRLDGLLDRLHGFAGVVEDASA